MKQVKAFGPQQLRVVEAEPPVPGEGEVLIAVRACGICGSDKWFWHVNEPTDYVAGHEAAGEVVALGRNVRGLRIGDRVAVNNVKGCGSCEACAAGQYVRCERDLTHMGYGFSEMIAVPERNCLKLDDAIDDETGSLIFDNWGTPFAALSRVEIRDGDVAAVFGCGPIGLAALSLAKLRGARIIAVDPLPSRRDTAERLGAFATLAPTDRLAERIKEASGQDGVNVVLECSGKASSYEAAFAAIKTGGTIAAIGENAAIHVNSSTIIHKHLTLAGSLYSSMDDGRAVQELIKQGKIDPLGIVTHRFALDELPAEFGKVVEGGEGLLKSLVIMNGEGRGKA